MTTTAPLADPLLAAPLELLESAPDTAFRPTEIRRRASRSKVVPLCALALLDSVSVAIAVLIVGPSGPLPSTGREAGNVVTLGLLWLILLMCCAAFAQSRGHRGPAVVRAGVVLALLCWSLPTVVAVTATPEQLIVLTALLTLFGLVTRSVADAPWSRALLSSAGARVVVAGEPDEVDRAVSELRRVPGERWDVVGTCVVGPSTSPCDDDGGGGLGLPAPDNIVRAIVAADADAVVVLPCRELDPARLRRLGWQLEATGTRVYVGTGLLDVAPSRAALVSAGDLSLLQLRAPSGRLARLVKATMDRAGAALLVVLLGPLLLCVAAAVRLDSAGPAIFRQVRVGRDGREFTLYKFRTMTVGADAVVDELAERNESEGAVLFKIRQDPRITRTGRLLRRYSIDELPQLANVLRGQMALVGPRPALPGEVARYDIDPRRRLAVRPGLTGLWQVSGRSDLSWEDTVRLDLHYVDNWSLGTDLRILRRTLHAVLAHDGAY
ncbi:exopolysaccharide biosynthesis polyprenyl glycosylphosphotransferase [Nocardioides sp. HB32]